MNTFVWLIALAAFIFMLTYNPSKGKLNDFIAPSRAPVKTCCNDPIYRAQNPQQCKSPYFSGLQFADESYACPTKPDKSIGGAIIGV